MHQRGHARAPTSTERPLLAWPHLSSPELERGHPEDTAAASVIQHSAASGNLLEPLTAPIISDQAKVSSSGHRDRLHNGISFG